MRSRIILLGALIAVWAAACIVPSVHPLYTPDTLVFEPALVGDWKVDETTTWSFRSRDDGKAYDLETTDDGEQASFAAHLVRLGGHHFLDLYPKRGSHLSFHEVHYVPVHSFARVRIEGDRFHLALLWMNWLKAEIEAGRVTIPHETVDGDLLLTASTEELQRFVSAAAANPAAFPDESQDDSAAFTAERIPEVKP